MSEEAAPLKLDLGGTHIDGQLCCGDGARQIRGEVDHGIGDVVDVGRERRGSTQPKDMR